MKRVVCVIVLAVALGLSSPSRADPPEPDPDLGGIVTFFKVAAVIGTAGGVVPALGNSVSIARKDRPGLGWIITGFSYGGLQLATGGLVLAGSRTSWFGIANAAIGAVNIGLASWAVAKRTRHHQAETSSTRLALVPVLTSDSSGGVGYGMGLQVAGW